MDNLTHILLGLAVAGLSGHPVSIHDPIYLAAAIGSQAPDFDIITHLKSNFSYLKSHRAISHSVPGLILWSAVITALLYLYSQTSWLDSFFWAFAGGVSHTVTDYFNTHGASIFWPLRQERQSNQVLNVTDPLLLVLLALPYLFSLAPFTLSFVSLSIFAIYILLRLQLRRAATNHIKRLYSTQGFINVTVMPNLKHIFLWDFILETKTNYSIGNYCFFSRKITVKTKLPQQDHSAFLPLVATTPLGQFFTTFTPFLYCDIKEKEDGLFVKLYDLRYYLNQKFIHSGTIYFDHNQAAFSSYLFTDGQTIKLPV